MSFVLIPMGLLVIVLVEVVCGMLDIPDEFELGTMIIQEEAKMIDCKDDSECKKGVEQTLESFEGIKEINTARRSGEGVGVILIILPIISSVLSRS